MRRPRVRFTVRRMMVAAAALAVIAWVHDLDRRARAFRRVAQRHAGKVLQYELSIDLISDDLGEDLMSTLGTRVTTGEAERLRRHLTADEIAQLSDGAGPMVGEYNRPIIPMGFAMVEPTAIITGYLTHASYHRDLEEKYRRAARYPWLPVAPDAPEPE